MKHWAFEHWLTAAVLLGFVALCLTLGRMTSQAEIYACAEMCGSAGVRTFRLNGFRESPGCECDRGPATAPVDGGVW